MPTGKTLGGLMISREQWLLREMRIVARLRLDGIDEGNLIDKAKTENIFQYKTERSLASIARACNRRIAAVESEAIVRIVAEGLPDASAQANLYMMMCTYPIVREFMIDEIARRYSELCLAYTQVDMNDFFTRLEAKYDNVATLSKATAAKMKQVLRRCLVECGMMKSPRSEELLPILVDAEVRDAIEAKGDTAALTVFNSIGVM